MTVEPSTSSPFSISQQPCYGCVKCRFSLVLGNGRRWQPKLFPKPVSACDLSGDFGWNLPIIAHATSPRGKDHLTAVGRWVPKSGSGCWLELLFIGNRSSQ